ncbi:MAG TPA: alpha/beta family hydrolase [Nitriliruptorales bacterium]
MRTTTEHLRLPAPGTVVDGVSAVVHRPSRATSPAVFLVPGAGGDLNGAGLTALAQALASRGHLAVRANLPYRESGRNTPPRADRAVHDYRIVFDAARRQVGPRRPWVAGGKSYGGRVASLAAAEDLACVGLLLYGYPLHPPGRPDELRVDHWPHVRVPCCFLQGTRDTFGDPDLLAANLGKLGRRAHVELVEGGDHSLRVAGKHAPDGVPRGPAAVLEERAGAIAQWLRGIEV